MVGSFDGMGICSTTVCSKPSKEKRIGRTGPLVEMCGRILD